MLDIKIERGVMTIQEVIRARNADRRDWRCRYLQTIWKKLNGSTTLVFMAKLECSRIASVVKMLSAGNKI